MKQVYRMIKSVSLSLVLLIIVFNLMGCGSDSGKVAPPPPPVTVFSENFQSYNQGPLTLPTANGWNLLNASGGTYAIEADDATNNVLKITQNNGTSYLVNDIAELASVTDYTISAKVKPGTAGRAGLVARYTDSSNHYQLVLRAGDKKLNLYSSSSTMIKSVDVPAGFNWNEWHELSLRVSGTTDVTIWAYLDGQNLLDPADSGLKPADKRSPNGKIGLITWSNTGETYCQIDEVKAVKPNSNQ
jgi:hypothetical protein